MNIGMFTDTYIPQKNGVATAIKLYRDEMKKLGHNVYLFVPQYSINFKRHEEDIFEFPAVKYAFEKEQRIAIPVSNNLFKIKNLELDVIHSHSPFTMGVFSNAVSGLLKIPIVGTHHTMYEHYLHYVPQIVRPSVDQTKKMIKRWCMKLNKVIAPTDNIRDELIEFGVPTEHVVTIPTGIDTDRFEEETVYDIRKEYNITDEHKIILFVGRLAKEKNIDFLIEVFDEYVKKDKNARFVIVGDGNERKHLEKIVEDKNLKNEVIFTGALPREKVIDVYKEADLFIFASYTETQGLVVLEAMAAGTPVVALGKMGVYDLMKDDTTGGIMIKELDKNDFLNAVDLLLNNDEKYTFYSERGKSFVRTNFSITTNVEKIIEIYKESMKG